MLAVGKEVDKREVANAGGVGYERAVKKEVLW